MLDEGRVRIDWVRKQICGNTDSIYTHALGFRSLADKAGSQNQQIGALAEGSTSYWQGGAGEKFREATVSARARIWDVTQPALVEMEKCLDTAANALVAADRQMADISSRYNVAADTYLARAKQVPPGLADSLIATVSDKVYRYWIPKADEPRVMLARALAEVTHRLNGLTSAVTAGVSVNNALTGEGSAAANTVRQALNDEASPAAFLAAMAQVRAAIERNDTAFLKAFYETLGDDVFRLRDYISRSSHSYGSVLFGLGGDTDPGLSDDQRRRTLEAIGRGVNQLSQANMTPTAIDRLFEHGPMSVTPNSLGVSYDGGDAPVLSINEKFVTYAEYAAAAGPEYPPGHALADKTANEVVDAVKYLDRVSNDPNLGLGVPGDFQRADGMLRTLLESAGHDAQTGRKIVTDAASLGPLAAHPWGDDGATLGRIVESATVPGPGNSKQDAEDAYVEMLKAMNDGKGSPTTEITKAFVDTNPLLAASFSRATVPHVGSLFVDYDLQMTPGKAEGRIDVDTAKWAAAMANIDPQGAAAFYKVSMAEATKQLDNAGPPGTPTHTAALTNWSHLVGQARAAQENAWWVGATYRSATEWDELQNSHTHYKQAVASAYAALGGGVGILNPGAGVLIGTAGAAHVEGMNDPNPVPPIPPMLTGPHDLAIPKTAEAVVGVMLGARATDYDIKELASGLRDTYDGSLLLQREIDRKMYDVISGRPRQPGQ